MPGHREHCCREGCCQTFHQMTFVLSVAPPLPFHSATRPCSVLSSPESRAPERRRPPRFSCATSPTFPARARCVVCYPCAPRVLRVCCCGHGWAWVGDCRRCVLEQGLGVFGPDCPSLVNSTATRTPFLTFFRSMCLSRGVGRRFGQGEASRIEPGAGSLWQRQDAPQRQLVALWYGCQGGEGLKSG